MLEKMGAITNLGAISPNGNSLNINNPETKQSFSNVLKSALNEVNKIENESDRKTELLAQGKIDDLHDVMITAKKAGITVETAVQIQQKAIDTYNEMMRMQI